MDNVGISLATVPPTLRQRRLALTAIALVIAAYGAIAPFAAIPLPRIVGYVPVVEGMVFVAELVTAIFLYSQFSVAGSRGSACPHIPRGIRNREFSWRRSSERRMALHSLAVRLSCRRGLVRLP